MRRLVLVLLTACAPAPATELPSTEAPLVAVEPMPPTPMPPPAPPETTFQATIEIAESPGGKKEQPVWLNADGGKRWLVSYRPTPLWRHFAPFHVEVTLEPYEPEGQALAGDHARLLHMRALDEESVIDPIEVGAERELRGQLRRRTLPPRTKSAGETITELVDETGHAYLLFLLPDDAPLDTDVVVTARPMKRSDFVAHLGGDYLWVLDVR